MAAYRGNNSEVDSPSDAKKTITSVSRVDVEHQPEDHAFTDGGFKAWLTVFGAVLILFAQGLLMSFGVFETYYTQHQLSHLSPTTVSWIGSMSLWIMLFSGSLWGRVFDVYGLPILLATGSTLVVLSTMIISVCTKFYQFLLVQGLLKGLVSGMVYGPVFASISLHFTKRRATAIGVAMASLGLSGVIFPIVAREMFPRIGFGWTLRAVGFIQLVFFTIGTIAMWSAGGRGRVTRAVSPLPDPMKSLHDAPFVLFVAGAFLIDFGIGIPSTYISSYAVSGGIASSNAFYTVSALNGGRIVGHIVGSLVADVVGRLNTAVLAAFLTGLLVLVFWMFAKGFVPLVVFGVMYGLCDGAYDSVRIACVSQISDIKEVGTRIGILLSIVSFAALAGAPAGGAVMKANGGEYAGMIALSGTVIIAGSLLLLLSKYKVNRNLLAHV